MPSVDSPQPDGLSATELEQLLELALAGNAVGMQVTICDPLQMAEIQTCSGTVN